MPQEGAAPDLARVQGLLGKGASPLTAREAQVLALVASGKTNRAIAHELHISEKTVARHLSNIFDKTGVSTRLELALFAIAHKLVTLES